MLENLNFNEKTKSAFQRFFHDGYWNSIKQVGNDAVMIVDDNYTFRNSIILKNAVITPDDFYNFECCFVMDVELLHLNDKYCLRGKYEGYDEPFSITFDDAMSEVKVFNCAVNTEVSENPWEYLRSIAFSICEKNEYFSEHMNQQEQELLPLLKELTQLTYWFESYRLVAFANLRQFTEKYGLSKITDLLLKLETNTAGSKSYLSLVNKICNLLDMEKCQPMWREIYTKLFNSQKEYPNKIEQFADKTQLCNIREIIQSEMEQYGYSGTYPDFYKEGRIKGLKLEESYNQIYFVGMSDRVRYCVHCTESLNYDNDISIDFIAGTAFLKKNEELTDIYSCMFNSKGKKLFHIVNFCSFLHDEDSIEHELRTSVSISVKRAECRRLNKFEKKEYYGSSSFPFGFFLIFLIFGGGLFSVILNVALMLFGAIVLLIAGETDVIKDMFTEYPWWKSILFSWLAFGAITGFLYAFTRRK